ncbi:hypothetical protein [Geodermatophilus pulveris]|uniref:hypothetical protein n=1 Tax=Geodermatophilus pulveris TaxID=1564159 RepID=UPI00117B4C03|nr:hypothetical protein [Geodermatophilus pulveris]
MSSSATVPAVRRGPATHDEAWALTRALGGRARLDLVDTAALLDPRGRHFQRLEWLGDSLLDHVTAHHRLLASARGAGCCSGRTHADLVSDDDLCAAVRGSGVLELLDWTPSAHRQADLVEACVAAAWLVGGWPDAAAAASRLVHPSFAAEAATLIEGSHPHLAEPPCSSELFRGAATLGSYVLEAAASLDLVARHPGDEGDLTARRHLLLAGGRLLPHARRPSGSCRSRGRRHLVDHVQASVGLEQLRAGADRAVAVARQLLWPPAHGVRS